MYDVCMFFYFSDMPPLGEEGGCTAVQAWGDPGQPSSPWLLRG